MTGAVSHRRLDSEFVLRRCEYFATIGLLPTPGAGFEPKRWLDNFEDAEVEHALYLLNSFVYLDERVTKEVLVAAVHALSRRFTAAGGDAGAALNDWTDFLETAIFVPVRGERPHLTDSGMHFARVVRDRFELDEDQLPDSAEAILRLEAEPRTPVVFVDDFVGTGNQFVATFKRRHELTGGRRRSFEELAANRIGRYYYCPVVACARGLRAIERRCPSVTVSPGYELPDAYSAFDEHSVIWPERLAESAERVLATASRRAGIPDSPGEKDHWRGYGGLGLALAFSHGPPPDATLPLFTWHENGWFPLLGGAA